MISIILFAATMGYSGTFPTRPYGPISGPVDPVPWRPVHWGLVWGLLGGILGGLAANYTFGGEQLAVIGLASFAGGRILNELGSIRKK